MNKRKLDKGTIVRTVLLVLTWINQILIFLGESPFGRSPIYIVISFAVTILMSAVTYWYNNSWTDFAKMSQDIYHILKDGKITKEEVEEFLQKHNKKTDKIEVDENDINSVDDK